MIGKQKYFVFKLSLFLLMGLILTCCKRQAPFTGLSPANWPADEFTTYSRLQNETSQRKPLGVGRKGMVASTSNALAVHAGLKALQKGGSAVDAVMTTALTQVVLHMGGATSFAGQMNMTFFEASTGKVHVMDAGYATLLEEKEPLTIPPYGKPSGRAVLVPGFMAGVEAAHKKFGRIPFDELFQPAIFLAEEGFDISTQLAAQMEQRRHVITRLPAGQSIFTRENGDLFTAGDHIRQPQVAETLQRISAEGASYMYSGEWAKKFVKAVREEGGKMTLEDLTRYEVLWPSAHQTSYRDYTIYAQPSLIEAFNILELADLRSLGRTSESAESLYKFIKISRISDAIGPQMVGSSLSPEQVNHYLPGIDISWDARMTKESARLIWEAMFRPEWTELEKAAEKDRIKNAESIANLIKDFRIPTKRPDHTAGIVAVDQAGNMAVLVHSVTSAVWGELGIFVDGISVVDPAAFAQHQIARMGPGKHWGGDGRGGPPLVLKDGKPVLGCGSTGAAYIEMLLQGIHDVLEFGLNPKEAAESPKFYKNWPPGLPLRQPVGPGQFPRKILESLISMGIDLEIVDDPSRASLSGTWVAITIDPLTGKIYGGVTPGTNGLAEGY